jgi:hypothetical protein
MMRRFTLALLFLAIHVSGEANRWPQYRGPAGAGISESAATVVALPSGHSSPSIRDDHLFVTSFDSVLDGRLYVRVTGHLYAFGR